MIPSFCFALWGLVVMWKVFVSAATFFVGVAFGWFYLRRYNGVLGGYAPQPTLEESSVAKKGKIPGERDPCDSGMEEKLFCS